MYWVTMTDRFMSGWGGAAGRISKYVIECDTWEDAKRAELAAIKRDEMKYVSIRNSKPYYAESKYHTQIVKYEDAPAFH
jgi:hypothetical protein